MDSATINKAIKKTRMTINEANMTIDELMKTLLENPLPEIDGYMQIMWDYDEPDFFDLFLTDDEELPKEKSELKQTITSTISDLVRQSQKKDPSLTEIDEECDKVNIFNMTPEEILERIKCRCRELKDGYRKKSEEAKEDTISVFSTRSHRKIKKKKTPSEEDEDKDRTNCKEFLKVKDYATFFIDDLLQEAEEKANATLPADKSQETNLGEETSTNSVVSTPEFSSVCSSIRNKDFTPAGGRELILESIQTWQLRKPWTYCIDFIAEDSDTCADFYKYEVKWSLPTVNYPIPQATASVFYTIEVSRVKGPNCPVMVTYNFETERYTFGLEDEIHHEVFLSNIIKCKKDFFKMLRI